MQSVPRNRRVSCKSVGSSQVWEALHEESRFGSSRCADARLYGNAWRTVERDVERGHESGSQRPVIFDKRSKKSANRPYRLPDGRGSELLRWHERAAVAGVPDRAPG